MQYAKTTLTQEKIIDAGNNWNRTKREETGNNYTYIEINAAVDDVI